MRVRLTRAQVALIVCALTIEISNPASSQNLQPQNRDELQRVFGTGRSELDLRGAGASPVLQPQTQQELKRTFGQTLELSHGIRMTATPDSTSRLQQLSLLTGNDPKSYVTG